MFAPFEKQLRKRWFQATFNVEVMIQAVILVIEILHMSQEHEYVLHDSDWLMEF